MKNCLDRSVIFSLISFLVLSLSTSAFAQDDSGFVVTRLNNSQPIIDQAMFAAVGVEDEGENINGPSLIRIPDWIPPAERADPSAVYYLYFAHHIGDYIRMAWATDVAGPWTLYQTGSQVPLGDRGVLDNGDMDLDLGLEVVIEENHLASPDVHIDNENQQIIMYFHSGSSTFFKGNEINSQNTWVSTSPYGLEFLDNIRPVRLGSSYFRVFSHGGELYSLDNSGFPRRALDPENPWEPTDDYYDGSTISSLWERHPDRVLQDPISDLGIARSDLRVRHTAVRVVGDELQVFYTQRGDSPERVLFSTIDLGVADWEDWRMTYPGELLLQPQPGWEGGQFTPVPSEAGAADEDVNELRDPDIFEDIDGSLYLVYSGRGEDALGIAMLTVLDDVVEPGDGEPGEITWAPSVDLLVGAGSPGGQLYVNTNGISGVLAINATTDAGPSPTINGVTFTAASDQTLVNGVTQNGVTLTTSGTGGSNQGAFNSGSLTGTATNDLLDGGLFNLQNVEFEFSGLTAGATYEVQFFINDSRDSRNNGVGLAFSDGVNDLATSQANGTSGFADANNFAFNGEQSGDSITGSFTPTGTTQSFVISGTNDGGATFGAGSPSAFNALQLRLIANPPVAGLLGDVNLDGVVDFFDISPFIAILTGNTFQFEADMNGDEVVDFFDISPFIAILSSP